MEKATELIRNKFPNHEGVFVLRNIEDFMIEFAKLHVEQALKQASEVGFRKYGVKLEDCFELRDEIENIYPLENIK